MVEPAASSKPLLLSHYKMKCEKSSLEVIKLEFSLRLKIKDNDWLLADTSAMIGCLRTRVRKQPIIVLYFESETELKFYNLEASHIDIMNTFTTIPLKYFIFLQLSSQGLLCVRGGGAENILVINVFHRGSYGPHSRSNWTRGIQLLLDGGSYQYL